MHDIRRIPGGFGPLLKLAHENGIPFALKEFPLSLRQRVCSFDRLMVLATVLVAIGGHHAAPNEAIAQESSAMPGFILVAATYCSEEYDVQPEYICEEDDFVLLNDGTVHYQRDNGAVRAVFDFADYRVTGRYLNETLQISKLDDTEGRVQVCEAFFRSA